MFFIKIDAEDTKNVVGFECGPRAEFDRRRAGDPLWIFVDFKEATLRIKLDEFLVNPTGFRVIGNNFLRKKQLT